jgi:hypothetical protein
MIVLVPSGVLSGDQALRQVYVIAFFGIILEQINEPSTANLTATGIKPASEFLDNLVG